MIDIHDAWYRTSVKALIYNEKGQVLLCKEQNGIWDLPGGGLDHGENPHDCLKRELMEEMGLEVITISNAPRCFVTVNKESSVARPWVSNVCYEVTVKNLNFSPSDECIEIGFYDQNNISNIHTIMNVVAVFKEIF